MDKTKFHSVLDSYQKALRTTPLDLRHAYDAREDHLKLSLLNLLNDEEKSMWFPVADLIASKESEGSFISRTLTRLKELHGYTGPETRIPGTTFTKQPMPLPMKNYNNLISLAQDNIMTTLRVAYVLTGAEYVFKHPITSPVSEGDFVVIKGQRGLEIGVVKEVHKTSQVEVHPTKQYDWTISVVPKTEVEAYNKQLDSEEEMTERLKATEKKAETAKAKAEILSNLSLEDKAILGLEAPKE